MTIHPLRPPEPRLTVGFLSPHNPHDRRTFSGTAYFAARALDCRPDLNLRILGHTPPGPLARIMRRQAPAIRADQVRTNGLDAVIGMVATGLLDDLIQQPPDCPIVHVTDATPGFLRDTYGWRVPAEADAAETRVAAHATRVIYSSKQIATRAPGDLSLPDLRPAAVPFGVNFDDLPVIASRKPSMDRINLLFVGIDWERKGGDIAVAMLDRLHAMDLDAQLTIVGSCPERHRHHPAITYAGYLNKNRPRDARKLARLYTDAHLFLLPSRADCTPMVVAEALAHATPVLASETGGIRSLITAGTGQVMAPYASPADWAQAAAALIADRSAYDILSDAAFDRGQQLSWSNWAAQIETLVRAACAHPVPWRERGQKAAVNT